MAGVRCTWPPSLDIRTSCCTSYRTRDAALAGDDAEEPGEVLGEWCVEEDEEHTGVVGTIYWTVLMPLSFSLVSVFIHLTLLSPEVPPIISQLLKLF